MASVRSALVKVVPASSPSRYLKCLKSFLGIPVKSPRSNWLYAHFNLLILIPSGSGSSSASLVSRSNLPIFKTVASLALMSRYMPGSSGYLVPSLLLKIVLAVSLRCIILPTFLYKVFPVLEFNLTLDTTMLYYTNILYFKIL